MHKGLPRLKLFLLLFVLLIPVFIFPVSKTSAYSTVVDNLPKGRESEWIENGYLFYNPDSGCEDVFNSNLATNISGSGSLSKTQEEFILENYQLAQQLSVEYGIPWETVMAQGIIESASGTSDLAIYKNNFFGIGAYDGCAFECGFSYSDPISGWRGYFENIRKTKTYRNHGVFTGDTITDPYTYLRAIKAAGYATDPDYVSIVSSKIALIEDLAAQNGWATSAELALQNPEMYENAAKYAAGGSGSTSLTADSSSDERFTKLIDCVSSSNSNYNPFISTPGYNGPLLNLITELPEGGMTEAEAKRLMEEYISLANGGYERYGVVSMDGTGIYNCSAFSVYFVNRFTGQTVPQRKGFLMASVVSSTLGVPLGKEIRPYSVFSTTKGKTIGCGHTGIVLAINGDKVITGEASYSDGEASIKIRDISEFDSTFTFAYLQ